MVKIALLTGLLSAVPAFALNTPHLATRHEDDSEIFAGSVSIHNNCTHHVYVTEKGSKKKPSILVPRANMVARLQRPKASNVFTYQISTTPMNDKKNPPEHWLEMVYRYNVEGAIAEGIIQMYPVLGAPNYTIAVSAGGSASAPGSAAAAAAAGGEWASVGAKAGDEGGSAALSLHAALCPLYGVSPELNSNLQPESAAETMSTMELGQTSSDLNVTRNSFEKFEN
ncbi:hypothetical protein VHEMI02196 [[Torrubiella] hemipterigena]|uniref:Uncharacterized protein n=1 Tax=[Torrubiella] hemipterigena TaxID=1531966 RepID=A0A0A1T9T4_9HYPO|nr:hypothetical protein VHEMI02196 [[Torrubiella] hemipterigena]